MSVEPRWLDFDASAAGTGAFEQAREAGDPRSLGLEHRDEAIRLRQRLGPCVAQRLKAFGSAIRYLPRFGETTRARLYHHQCEVVRDDVVQVSGDPAALALHRQLDESVLLSLELACASCQFTHQLSAPPHLDTAPPRRKGGDRDFDVRELREPDVDLNRRHERHGGCEAVSQRRVSATRSTRG